MKNKQNFFQFILILGTIILFCIFLFKNGLLIRIFIKEINFPKEDISKKFVFTQSTNEIENRVSEDNEEKMNFPAISPNLFEKSALEVKREMNDCEEEFDAIFSPFLKEQNPVKVDNARAIIILEDLENFDFKSNLFKRGFKKGGGVSPCSNQSSILLLSQIFSDNSLYSWEEETLKKMRNVITKHLITMTKLPGSIQDFENIFIQLEIIHEEKLFEGVYKEDLKKLRYEFEKVRGLFELKDFISSAEDENELNSENLEESLKNFKLKIGAFLKLTLKEFDTP